MTERPQRRGRDGTFAEFLRHLLPRRVRAGDLPVRYTLCLGGLALTSLLLCTVSGVLLLLYYQPTPDAAYGSILFLETHVPLGGYLRSLHRLTADASLVLLGLHGLRVFLTGAYQPPRRFNWVIGVGLLAVTVFLAYSGVLLPMDETALWATQTGLELVRSLPGGAWLQGLLAPDGAAGPLTLLRFYALHIAIVPVVAAVLTVLHFYRVRRNRGLLPYL